MQIPLNNSKLMNHREKSSRGHIHKLFASDSLNSSRGFEQLGLNDGSHISDTGDKQAAPNPTTPQSIPIKQRLCSWGGVPGGCQSSLLRVVDPRVAQGEVEGAVPPPHALASRAG